MVDPRRRRRLIVVAIVAISLIILTIAANAILSYWLNEKLSSKLASKNVSYDDLRVNIFKRSVTIDSIKWNRDSIELDRSNARVATIGLRGISFWSLLIDRQIEANQLLIEGGDINLTNHAFRSKRIANSTVTIPFQSLLIDQIVLNSMHVNVGRDSIPIYTATIDAVVTGFHQDSLQVWKDPTSYLMQNVQFSISDLVVSRKESPYRIRVDRTDFDRQAGKMTIDCVFVEPLKGKYEFARAFRKQVTRTEVVIPSIQLSKVSISKQQSDTTITIGEIIIDNPKVVAFKDKRLPFIRDYNIPLPMEPFRELPWAIEIDTMKVNNGHITYEEFPEDGFKTGYIFFSELNAVFSGLMNRDYSAAKYATINTDSKLMGSGRLSATFPLPLKEDHPYQASATLTNMPLTDMNPMLEHVTYTSVESGTVDKLSMMFNYNEFTSKGTLNIAYTDLKVKSLNKEKEFSVNPMMSLIVNAAVRKDLNQSGTIDILRERRKYVFNLWAQSAVDGLKSAVMPNVVKNASDRRAESRK